MSECGHGYGKREHCDTCSAADMRGRRDFAWAQRLLRDGFMVARRGWVDRLTKRLHGRPEFIFRVPQWSCLRLVELRPEYGSMGEPFIAKSCEDRSGPAPWVPSAEDLDATDWYEVRP